MDIKSMQCVLKVLEEGTLSKAAAKLFLTQPSLSRIIAKVEKKIGVPIFDKTVSPWKLTYAGELFVNKAKIFLELEEQFLRDVYDILNQNKGRIVVGTQYFEERYFLPQILSKLKEQCADLKIEFLSNINAKLEKLIIENKVDFSLLVLPISSYEIEYEVIKHYEILLALPIKHELANNYKLPNTDGDYPELDVSLLKKEPFVVLRKGYPLRQTALTVCNNAGFTPKIALEAEKSDSAQIFTANNYGATFVLDQIEKNPSVAYFKIKNQDVKHTLALAYKKGKILNDLEKQFLQLLQEK